MPLSELTASPTSNGPRNDKRALDELKVSLTSKHSRLLPIKRTPSAYFGPHLASHPVQLLNRNKTQWLPVAFHAENCLSSPERNNRPRLRKLLAIMTLYANGRYPNANSKPVPGLYGPYRLLFFNDSNLSIACRRVID